MKWEDNTGRGPDHHGPHGLHEPHGPRGPHGRHGHHHMGPQTFRRGRALEFLERLQVKQTTLKQQLEQPELQSIREVISGELKAVEAVLAEFVQLFDLREAGADESSPNNDHDEANTPD